MHCILTLIHLMNAGKNGHKLSLISNRIYRSKCATSICYDFALISFVLNYSVGLLRFKQIVQSALPSFTLIYL